jgi:hypothetical protein
MDSDKNTQDPTVASEISHLARSSLSARFSKMIPLDLLIENQNRAEEKLVRVLNFHWIKPYLHSVN